jgi:hypothetical protein
MIISWLTYGKIHQTIYDMYVHSLLLRTLSPTSLILIVLTMPHFISFSANIRYCKADSCQEFDYVWIREDT